MAASVRRMLRLNLANLEVAAGNLASGAVTAAIGAHQIEMVGLGTFVALMVVLNADTEARARPIERARAVELHGVFLCRNGTTGIAHAADKCQLVDDDLGVRVVIVERDAAIDTGIGALGIHGNVDLALPASDE